MLKNLACTLGLTALLLSTTSQALPIVEADAFEIGDNKAVLETSTGLVWMDFGLTNNKTYQQVINELESTYKGWRLPTEAEFTGLWKSLFSNNPGWFTYGNFGMVRNPSTELGNHIQSIIDIWGYNSLSEMQEYVNDELVNQYPIIGGFGTVQFDDGRYGQAGIFRSLDEINSHGGLFFDLYDESFLNGSYFMGSTLLVKSSGIEVPEPSTVLLLALGLFGLFQRRGALK